MAGKGGTGKTTISINLALALRDLHIKVGIADLDLTTPNVIKALGLRDASVGINVGDTKWIPANELGLKILSTASIIEDDKPFLWDGKRRKGVISEVIESTEWGDTEILILDLPPGTTEETTGMLALRPDGVVMVTNPHPLAQFDYAKMVDLLNLYKIPILKRIINMAYFKPKCPHVKCTAKSHRYDIFGDSDQFKDSYKIPLDQEIAKTNRVNLDDLAKELIEKLREIKIKEIKKSEAKEEVMTTQLDAAKAELDKTNKKVEELKEKLKKENEKEENEKEEPPATTGVLMDRGLASKIGTEKDDKKDEVKDDKKDEVKEPEKKDKKK